MISAVRVPSQPGYDFGLPPALEGLGELAYNLWWSWTPRAGALFARIDSAAWSRYRSPIPVLAAVEPGRWTELLADEDFMVDASRLLDEFERYLANGSDSWYRAATDADPGASLPGPVAYFCAEYGIHESMQIYSGGLGILAGDHCKLASDAALPFIGVGLLYRRGYFRQQIDADGHQEHAQPDLDPAMLPRRRARGRDGSPLQVSVDFPDRKVHVAVWLAQVGRVPLLLLDTDIPANEGSDRPITHILYVRGREMRLCQEIVLGIGGVRALRGLGIEPAAWHLNEGHSAFLLLERARELVVAQPGLGADEALRHVGYNSVFTIHTPVKDGNEQFDRALRFLERQVAEGQPADAVVDAGNRVVALQPLAHRRGRSGDNVAALERRLEFGGDHLARQADAMGAPEMDQGVVPQGEGPLGGALRFLVGVADDDVAAQPDQRQFCLVAAERLPGGAIAAGELADAVGLHADHRVARLLGQPVGALQRIGAVP